MNKTIQPTAEPIIQVKDLVKRYKKAKQNAVDGLSFDVMPGGSTLTSYVFSPASQ